MKQLAVDQSKCQGCGACVSIAPDTFGLIKKGDWYVSEPVNPPKDKKKELLGAIKCCPVQAISIKNSLDKEVKKV